MNKKDVLSDQFKREVRATLLTLLDKYQDRVFRKQINDIFRIITPTDFPVHYPELVQYFMNNMKGLKEVLKDDQMLLSDLTYNFVSTFKIVMAVRSQKKLGDNRNLFYNVYFKLLEEFHGFWDYFHANTQRIVGALNDTNFLEIQRFIKLARKADRIYISFLCNGCEEMAEK